MELSALNEYVEMYRKSNARLFAISPGLPEQSRAVVEKHNLNFEILFDQGNQLAQKLDLVHGFPDELKELYQSAFGIDVEAANGDPSWTLPMPSRFVIGQDHRVKSLDVNASYTVRPEPQETLKVVMS